MTDRQPVRLPAHVLVMLSASTAVYALVLAGVAGVQSRGEAALLLARGPVARAIEDVAAGYDALEERLGQARAAYAAAAAAYGAAGGGVSALEAQLDELAALMARIDGVSRSLPTSGRLPAVLGSLSGGAPATHATTRASGG